MADATYFNNASAASRYFAVGPEAERLFTYHSERPKTRATIKGSVNDIVLLFFRMAVDPGRALPTGCAMARKLRIQYPKSDLQHPQIRPSRPRKKQGVRQPRNPHAKQK